MAATAASTRAGLLLPRRCHHERISKTSSSSAGRYTAARISTTASAATSAIPPSPSRIAVFVSGGGSNLRALHAATRDGRIPGIIVAVVTDKPDCGGVLWARECGDMETLVYPAKKSDPSSGLSPADLVRELKDRLRVDVVLLAGYLRLIPPELCRAYTRKMLNIHPALLPAFGGKGMHGHHVHEAVVASGARFTGPTIHFVTEVYDEV